MIWSSIPRVRGTAFRNGRFHRMPILAGFTKDEGTSLAGPRIAAAVPTEAGFNDQAKKLFGLAGKNFDELHRQAATREFQPVPLGVTASVSLHNKLRSIDSRNVLGKLEGTIDDAAMRGMNAAAELDGKDFASIASAFIAGTATNASSAKPGFAIDFWRKLTGPDFGRLTAEHLSLVFVSLVASIVIGIPLGILCARHPGSEGVILGATGVVQTIPSLALLAFLIPVTGRIGIVPAFIALALYALLPIVRNTYAALAQISRGMKDAARSLGMTPGTILGKIELPLGATTILAGIKTSAVINVGTATIAAFIGAGGYGERIVTGLALNDNAMLLAGAVPAAVLALLIEGVFRIGERFAMPEGLRYAR